MNRVQQVREYWNYNRYLYFGTILTIGLMIPYFITENKGFNLVQAIPCGINDLSHKALKPVTEYLAGSRTAQYLVIYVSSLLLDLQYVYLAFTIARKRKIIHALPFILMYVTRFVVQRVCYLPFPSSQVWTKPALPSFVVFYDSVGDFYPSGHVAFPLLCSIYFKRIGYRLVSHMSMASCLYQAVVVLATNTHYFIDVVGGVTLSYTAWALTRKYTFPCKVKKALKIMQLKTKDPRYITESD